MPLSEKYEVLWLRHKLRNKLKFDTEGHSREAHLWLQFCWKVGVAPYMSQIAEAISNSVEIFNFCSLSLTPQGYVENY